MNEPTFLTVEDNYSSMIRRFKKQVENPIFDKSKIFTPVQMHPKLASVVNI
jgi:hypothetical protein